MSRLAKSRKGQFYILIMLILLVYLFAIRQPATPLSQPTDSFQELYQNFMTESPKVINSGIYDGNMTQRFKNFSAAYTAYAKTKSPDFTMAYALLDQGQVLVSNSLNEPLNVTTTNTSVLVSSGTDTTINKTSNMTFYIGGIAYRFAFTRDTELKAVFRKKSRNEVVIHVED